MTIKQSTTMVALVATIALTGAGCLARPEAAPTEPTAAEQTVPRETTPPDADGRGAARASDIDTSDWVRYQRSQAGQIGMSFLYPPELSPVAWDTAAWGEGAVGVDFGGFGVARIPNPDRASVEEWLAQRYPDFAFDVEPVNVSSDPFAAVLTDGACEALVVTDDFDEDAGLSGIGGTMFVDMGDGTLYAFTLGQDWNQEIGDREAVIDAIMASVEWFAEQTRCPETVTVRDDRVGIAFEAPRDFAPVVMEEEFGWGMEEGQAAGAPMTCLTNRIFLSMDEDRSSVFLTVNDTWECEVPGRDGYWGDQARQFSTEDDVAAWCETKDACDSFVNANGITVWHASTNSVDDWGATLEGVDEYAAWNPNRSVHGILFSNQGFLKHGLGRQESALRAIANSLTFAE